MKFSAFVFPFLLLVLLQGGSCRGGKVSTDAQGRGGSQGAAANQNRKGDGNRAAPDGARTDAGGGRHDGAPGDSNAREGGVPAGTWGGAHVRLEVREGGADLEFDCARGRISESLRPDAAGNFDAPGTFTRERGGPVRSDEEPDARPARYSGRVSGETMTLRVRLADSGAEAGEFTLARGRAGRLFKCL